MGYAEQVRALNPPQKNQGQEKRRDHAESPKAHEGVSNPRIWCVGTWALALLLPFALRGQTRIFVVPFHSVNGMILLDATVNGKSATFLLDTGANVSIVDYRAAGFPALKLDVLRPTGKTGAGGGCLAREIPKLSFGLRSWLARRTCLMDLTDASKRMGVQIDGFIGQDLLQEFRAVRINFERKTLELEQ